MKTIVGVMIFIFAVVFIVDLLTDAVDFIKDIVNPDDISQETEMSTPNDVYTGIPAFNVGYTWQQEDNSNLYECSWCKGTGICKECGGTGKSDAHGVLAAFGCPLCDKTGRCVKCGGDGMSNY